MVRVKASSGGKYELPNNAAFFAVYYFSKSGTSSVYVIGMDVLKNLPGPSKFYYCNCSHYRYKCGFELRTFHFDVSKIRIMESSMSLLFW